MYIPAAFREDDIAVLHQLMKTHNFATLFSQVDGEPFVTHLPFLLDTAHGPCGRLTAHFARANPHWQHLSGDQTVLVVFQGPHDYISPGWYANPQNVPTWNYAVVHAYGKPHVIDEPAVLLQMVKDVMDYHRTPDWDPATIDDILEAKIKGIVGLEIDIERLEGKYKFNQNRSIADRQGVIAAMDAQDTPNTNAIAAIMRGHLGE